MPSRHQPPATTKSAREKLNERWRKRVLDEKEKRGWSYRRLAAEILKHTGVKISHGALQKMLTTDEQGNEKQQGSGFMAAVSATVGIPLSSVDNPELTEEHDPREVALLKAFRQKSKAEQDAFLLLITGPIKSD